MVNQDYLIRNGFSFDKTAPNSVNRWERSDGETHFNSSYFVSVTLSDKGDRTLYGFVNFHSSDGHGYIVEHRFFDGSELSIADFEKFMDKNCRDLPSDIKSTRK